MSVQVLPLTFSSLVGLSNSSMLLFPLSSSLSNHPSPDIYELDILFSDFKNVFSIGISYSCSIFLCFMKPLSQVTIRRSALVGIIIHLSFWVVQLPLQCGGISLEQFLLKMSSAEETLFLRPAGIPPLFGKLLCLTN